MGFDLNKILQGLSEKVEELSSNIPFLNSKKEKKHEDDDDLTQEVTDIDNKDDRDDDDEIDENSKRPQVVKIIIILGIVYVGVDEFLLKETPPPGPVRKIVKKKRKKKRKKIKKAMVEKKIETPKPMMEKMSEVVPVEVKKVEEKREKKISNVVDKVVKEEMSMKKEMKPEVNQPMEDHLLSKKMVSPEKKEAKNDVESMVKEPIKSNIGPIINKLADVKPIDIKYSPAPKYNTLGRGLIYNCNEGHWACVAQEEFFSCSDNQKWNKSERNRPECFVLGSYATTKDCRIVQLYNINMAVKTNFCQKADSKAQHLEK